VAKEQQFNERREHRRLAQPFEARWEGASGSGQCRLSDLSVGGCFVQAMAQPAVGERTKVTIAAGPQTLTIAGRVVAVERGLGFSMQFDAATDDATAEVRRHLGALIAERSR
jgi:PilZ domain